MSRWGRTLTVCLFMAAQTAFLAYAAARHGPTRLESAHLAAGVSHWRLGRHELYRVNPPLPRMIAAVPAVLLGCETDWSHYYDGPGSRAEYHVADDFVRANGVRFSSLLIWARWISIPIYLMGGYFAFRWAEELYGAGAGFVTLLIWTIEPNLLAHAGLVTSDCACWSFGIVSLYFFWKWLDSPSRSSAALAGVFLGVAALSKLTWLILFGLFPVLWLLWKCFPPRGSVPQSFDRSNSEPHRSEGEFRGPRPATVYQLGAILLLAIYVLNLGYRFDRTLTPLGDFEFVSAAFTNKPTSGERGNRWRDSLLARLPVPVPRDYLLGIDAQSRDLESYPLPSYLNGEWRHGGWWYFYALGLLMKVPLGIWGLLLIVVAARCLASAQLPSRSEEAILVVPAIAVLVSTSAEQEFNLHLRYVFPTLALLAVFLGQSARLVLANHPRLRFAMLFVTLGAAALSSLSVYPYHHAYFNELAGGPGEGHRHLLGSSFDWGQDLPAVLALVGEHEGLIAPIDVTSDLVVLRPAGFRRRMAGNAREALPSRLVISGCTLIDTPSLLSLYSLPSASRYDRSCPTAVSVSVAEIPSEILGTLQWYQRPSRRMPLTNN